MPKNIFISLTNLLSALTNLVTALTILVAGCFDFESGWAELSKRIRVRLIRISDANIAKETRLFPKRKETYPELVRLTEIDFGVLIVDEEIYTEKEMEVEVH